MEEIAPQDVKQEADWYDSIGDSWKASSDMFWNKGMGAHARDEGLQLWSLSDEAGRVASSVKGAGGGLKGLGKTLTGQGNLGGFRDPLYQSPTGAVSKAKTAGAKAIKNPTTMQRLGANKLNTGMAAFSLANAGSAGWHEFSGQDLNPLSVFMNRDDGSLGWHPENLGSTDYEEEYVTDDETGEVQYQKDSNGNFILDRAGNQKPIMRRVLDENGNPIPIKGRRTKAHGGSTMMGVGEAMWNDLTVGGYDAMRGNMGGVADLADMVGIGGDWTKAIKRNAREYVDNRDGAVDLDPLGAGALSEAVAGKIFDAYNNFMYPSQNQQSPNSL